jgi:rod shape-determining protein MreD|tara:strand:+ start:15463 stop:15951 length:489 start_codon:yes stop_codon:yes gene_type:complete
MVVNQGSGHWVITSTLLAAVMLSILPMPLWAQWGRPAIVAMVLIYWVIALPEHVGIGVAWTVGLLQDIVAGTPLGQNALALSVVAYLALILYQRLRMFTPVQQAVVVFVLIGLNQLLCHWIQTLTGTVSPNLLFLLPALISALLWPVLSVFLRLLRRNYYVN